MPKISVIIPTVREVDLNEKCLKKQTFTDFEVIIARPEGKPEGCVWTFNRDMNTALKKAQGELVVSYQDKIWMHPTGLEKFWEAYKATGQCVSGVGHIYQSLDEYGKPENRVWSDPRMRTDLGTFYECMPNDWELNYACAPLKAFYDIGGFNERMDEYYGMDNVDVALRMDKKGWKFYLDQTNECRGLYHERNPKWDELHWMHHGFYEHPDRQETTLHFLT